MHACRPCAYNSLKLDAISGISLPEGVYIDSSIVSRMAGALAHRDPDGIDTRQVGMFGPGAGGRDDLPAYTSDCA
jgi:hypothetical protein